MIISYVITLRLRRGDTHRALRWNDRGQKAGRKRRRDCNSQKDLVFRADNGGLPLRQLIFQDRSRKLPLRRKALHPQSGRNNGDRYADVCVHLQGKADPQILRLDRDHVYRIVDN